MRNNILLYCACMDDDGIADVSLFEKYRKFLTEGRSIEADKYGFRVKLSLYSFSECAVIFSERKECFQRSFAVRVRNMMKAKKYWESTVHFYSVWC